MNYQERHTLQSQESAFFSLHFSLLLLHT